MRNRALLLIVVVGMLVPLAPASAQDTSGWLYVSRGGEIIAMRPDGSGAVNLTQTPGRIEDQPDVSNISGRTLYVLFTIPAIDGQSGEQRGVGDLNLVSGGYDDRIPASSAQLGDPSHGSDDTYLYIHENFRQIVRYDVFTGAREEMPGTDQFGGVSQPSGSPTAPNGFAYTAGGFGSSAVRVQDFDVPQDGAVGSPADGTYSQAQYPSYAPDGSYVVFSCRSGDGQWNLCASGTVPTENTFRTIPTPTDAFSPVVSPQGDRVAWRDAAGNVWVAGIDGSNPSQIATGDGGSDPAVGLDWGPDIPLIAAPPAPEPDPQPEPEPEPEPDPAPNTPLPPTGVDDDPGTTDRAEFSQPGPLSVAVSTARFSSVGAAFAGGSPSAAYAVLSRDDNFADSLAGSPLTGRGPLLFTSSTSLSGEAAQELQRVLLSGGTVYLLGGEVALSAEVEEAVRDLGLAPQRLAGPSRFETSVTVAEEVLRLDGSTDEVLIARGNSPEDNPTAAWADSVTGGAYAATGFIPVVVTPSASLHPAVADFVEGADLTATLLGGTAALSQEIADALPGSRRIAGASRADTAGLIATDLIGLSVDEPRTILLFDGFSEDGWTFGLAGAGLAADLGGALLVAGADTLPPETQVLLSSCGEPVVETLLLGWEGVLSADLAQQVDALDGTACD